MGDCECITDLPAVGCFVYLSLITGAHSRQIVGWHVHERLQTEQVAQVLKMARKGRQSRQRRVHHSTQGACSTAPRTPRSCTRARG